MTLQHVCRNVMCQSDDLGCQKVVNSWPVETVKMAKIVQNRKSGFKVFQSGFKVVSKPIQSRFKMFQNHKNWFQNISKSVQNVPKTPKRAKKAKKGQKGENGRNPRNLGGRLKMYPPFLRGVRTFFSEILRSPLIPRPPPRCRSRGGLRHRLLGKTEEVLSILPFFGNQCTYFWNITGSSRINIFFGQKVARALRGHLANVCIIKWSIGDPPLGQKGPFWPFWRFQTKSKSIQSQNYHFQSFSKPFQSDFKVNSKPFQNLSKSWFWLQNHQNPKRPKKAVFGRSKSGQIGTFSILKIIKSQSIER